MSCPTDNELAALVDDALSPADRSALEAHLDDCPACTAVVGELARLVAPDTARTWQAGRSADELVAWWQRAIAVVAELHRRDEVHGALGPDAFVIAGDRIELAAPAPMPPTAGYTAVEVLHGAPPSAKSDQFAICAAMWEALAGKRPFTGATVGALAVTMTMPLALPPAVLRHVLAALRRGLDPDPAKRWPDLDALSAGFARQPPRRWPLVVAVVVVIVAVLIALL